MNVQERTFYAQRPGHICAPLHNQSDSTNLGQASNREISLPRSGNFLIDAARQDCDDSPMTYPRSHLVSDDEPGFYHVVSRCVRLAFLCGTDRFTGRCFEHRRQWIEDRILELADAFSVSVYSYAVMSNHFHAVIHVDPSVVASWSDEEVARRWLSAFPGALKLT